LVALAGRAPRLAAAAMAAEHDPTRSDHAPAERLAAHAAGV